MSVRRSVSEHYNRITRAWIEILGNHFHVGYFSGGDSSLDQATIRLVRKLAEWGKVGEGIKLLDVGCGSGAPALELHRKYRASVRGISLSEGEVGMASSAVRELGLDENLTFLQCDMLANDFSDESFDFVWLMESSHLFKDKEALFSEVYRLLKEKGTVLLCDFVLQRDLELADVFRLSDSLESLEKAFGRIKSEPVAKYREILKMNGFCCIESKDVTKFVRPTPLVWLERIEEKRKEISEHLSDEDVEAFVDACHTMDQFFEDEFLGYAFMRAVK